MFSVSNRPVIGHGPHVAASGVVNVKQLTVTRPSLVERIRDNVRYNYNHLSRESAAMKWSSSNSSLSSGAGDRKSIFYTDPDAAVHGKTMTAKADDLRDKLQRTEESLELQVRKCENLISFFTTQIHNLTDELETEKSWRTNHLTKIVKALLCFEAKLKNDQKLIRSQLYEKDGEINRLHRAIVVLRERYGDTSDLNVDICEAAQYCPTCRKEYHLLETKDVAVQVYHRNQCTTTTNTDTSPTQSVEYLSSSEEGITSFVEARRSKKYMSKRTSGTFRDYLRSRSGGSDQASSPPQQQQSAQHEECGATTFNNNIKNINNNINNNNTSNNNHYQKQHSRTDDKENRTVVFVAEKKRKNKETLFKRNSTRGSYSSYINNMHGFRTRSNSDILLNGRNDDDDDDDDDDNDDDHDDNNDGGILCGTTRSLPSDGICNENEHDDTGSEHIDDRNANGYCNESTVGVGDDEVFQSSNSSFLKKYETEDAATINEFESTDDWYASASDMDDSDGGLSKPYGYNAVNPVLECVNQILLQQSMDGHIEIPSSPDANENSPKEPRNQKRVHFSTQNSMVQVPRTDTAFPSISVAPEKPDNPKELHSFSYESVYSNEYEPIGSENTCTTNHYVDMESKIGSEDRPEKSKTPPALPPKPANLMKIRQALKISVVAKAYAPAQSTPDITVQDNESEPDYCSISEVAVPIVKCVRIVADVHQNADEMSTVSEDTKTDVTDESFADIPKLPNVAAIISPKKEVLNQFIAQDNYITKSPVKMMQTKPLPSILAEINRKNKSQTTPTRIPKMTTISETKSAATTGLVAPIPMQSTVTPIVTPVTSPIVDIPTDDKMPLQAEFDWYNLDAEYGRVHRSDDARDGVGEMDPSGLEVDKCNDDGDLGIEYNLDEEFIQIDEVDEHESVGDSQHRHHKDPHTNLQHLPKTTSIMKFDPMAGCDTPHKSFETFLHETGLTSKPLPRKRKIFYSAPFV